MFHGTLQSCFQSFASGKQKPFAVFDTDRGFTIGKSSEKKLWGTGTSRNSNKMGKRSNEETSQVESKRSTKSTSGRKRNTGQEKQAAAALKRDMRSLQKLYCQAIKDQQTQRGTAQFVGLLSEVRINGKTLDEVKVELDEYFSASGEQNVADKAHQQDEHIMDLDEHMGDEPQNGADGTGHVMMDTDEHIPPLEQDPGQDSEDEDKHEDFDTDNEDEDDSDDGPEGEDAIMQSATIFAEDQDMYPMMVRKCYETKRESMLLTHSEEDETTSAIMTIPGRNSKNLEKVDWNVVYQAGFIVLPSEKESTPVYFCDCCQEGIEARMQAEMLLGYTTAVTDELNPHNVVSACVCDHISTFQDIVKHSGMNEIEFADSVRQTCKWFSHDSSMIAPGTTAVDAS
jgi:hypothetical protein